MSIELQQNMEQKHIDKFFELINKNGLQTEYVKTPCWVGNEKLSKDERFFIGKKRESIQRISYVIHFGPIPEGEKIYHFCNNGHCVNPEHLYAGTHNDFLETRMKNISLDLGLFYVDENEDGYVPRSEREFPNPNKTLSRIDLTAINRKLIEKNERVCSNCEEIQPLDNFLTHHQSGYHSYCKDCTHLMQKKNYEKNRDKIIAKQRIYNALPETKAQRKKTDYERRNHPVTGKEVREREKETTRKYRMKRYKEDSLYRLESSYRRLLLFDLEKIKSKKDKENGEYSRHIRGCSLDEFKEWLERDGKYKVEDHGKYLQLDHIVPRSLRQNKQDVLDLNHYTNFRLLPIQENNTKSDELPRPEELPPELYPPVLAIYERALKERGGLIKPSVSTYETHFSGSIFEDE